MTIRGRVSVSAGWRRVALRIWATCIVVGALGVTIQSQQPALRLQPSSLGFSAQVVGTVSTPRTVNVRNNLTTPVAITSIASNSAEFIQSNDCGPQLAGRGQCTITVSFSPAAAGPRSGVITILHNAGGSPQSIPLGGDGLEPVVLSPATLEFGTQAIGTTSNLQSISLTNQQSVPLAIASMTASGDFTIAIGCGATLLAGRSCNIRLRFSPTAPGLRTGTLTVTHNAAGSPTSASLRGTGTAPNVSSITVTPANPTIALGRQQQFTATGTFSNGTTTNVTSAVTWASSSAGVATISNAPATIGTATSVAQGGTTITATLNGVVGQTTLTVGPPALVSIAVTPASASIPLGLTQQFTATGTYSNGSTQNLTSSVTWSSSSTATATIGNTGLATSVTQGSTTITATLGGASGTAALTVAAPALVSIAVTPGSASIALGLAQQFTATGTYTNGSTQNLTASATWSSSSPGVATVNSAGLATSVAQGSTTITATSSGISGSATLIVGAPQLVSIAVTPATASVALGRTQQFAATGTYTDGSSQNLTGSAAWSSSAPGTATVNSTGLATSTAQGATTIAASVGAISGSATLTVTAPELTSIAVTPSTASVALGLTRQFTATGTYTDGSTQNLTASASWSSSLTGVATINATGLATSVGQGGTTITATSGTVSGTATLTVTPAELVTISVTPVSASIALGLTQQFTATGNYTDGSTQNLTSSATWSSSATGVATINSSGLATSVAPGSTTITATSGAVGGTATLTVTAAQLVTLAVSPQGASVAAGQTLQFTATGTYSDNTTQNVTMSATWTSSAPAFATISNAAGTRGRATGVAAGATTITATIGSIAGTSSLTVTGTSASLVSIAILPPNPTVPVGGVRQLAATGSYSDNSTRAITTEVTWSSSNTNVATVSNSAGTQGLLRGVGGGSATITATLSGRSSTTTVTTVAAFAYVTLSSPDGIGGFGVSADGAAAVALTGSPFGSAAYPDSVVAHPSGRFVYVAHNNSNVSNYQLSAYTVDGNTGALSPVQGSPYPVAGYVRHLAVEPSGRYLYATLPNTWQVAGFQIDATTGGLTPLAGSPFTFSYPHFPWALAFDPSGTTGYLAGYYYNTVTAVRVEASGALTPVGTAVSIGGYALSPMVDPTGKFVFVVDPNADRLSVFQRDAGTGALTPVAGSPYVTGDYPQTVEVAPNGAFVYVGNNDNTISAFVIDAATGVLTPVPGSPFAVPGGVRALAIDPSGRAAYVLGYYRLQVFALDGTTGALTAGAVTSWNQSYALKLALAVSRTAAGATLTALQVVPAPVTLVTSLLGTTQQLTAVGTYSDGTAQFLTASATWTSSDGTVATVSNTAGSQGRVTSTGYGTTTITASFGGFTAQTTLTVSAPPLTELRITPLDPTIVQGTAVQLTALGTFADGTTRSVTADASWASSVPAVATASNAAGNRGLTTGLSAGSSAVTATLGGMTATTTVTVVAGPTQTAATGRALYATLNSPDGVAGLGIHPTTGAVTLLPGSPFGSAAYPDSVVAHPSGRFVYVAHNNSNVSNYQLSAYTVDGNTGALSPVQGSPYPVAGYVRHLAVEPWAGICMRRCRTRGRSPDSRLTRRPAG